MTGLQEQFDRVTGRNRLGERIASSTPNMDLMNQTIERRAWARDFVVWMETEKGATFLGDLGGLLAEWVGVDLNVLEDEKRWALRHGRGTR